MSIPKALLAHAISGCFAFSLLSTISWAADAPFVYPEVQSHSIESEFVDQTFEINVLVPIHLADGSESFPVLYLTDSYGRVLFEEITTMMQLSNDIPRFIMVGIGYENANLFSALSIRARDLTHVETEQDRGSGYSGIVQGVPALDLDKTSGGAPEFLRFIREELKPFINENYPTNPEDNGYFGDSLGGLFGLFTLFNEPDTFNRYIIGSPSIWWEDMAILNDARAFIDTHRSMPLPTKIFFGVGEREAPQMINPMFELESQLKSANIDGLETSSYMFPDQTHNSVISMNYVRGLQAVYTKPAVSFFVQALTPPEQQ